MQNGQTKNIKINSLKGGALTLVSNMDKFSIHSNKRNKIDYQVQKEGEKIKIEIKKVIIGEVISLVSTSFEDKTTSGLPYSLYPNWFWGLNNK